MIYEHEYPNLNRATYQIYANTYAQFVPVCEKCHRFVKADKSVLVNKLGELSDKPNATCSKCGRTHMPFEGFF